MIIEIVNTTTVTLIDGADRSSGKIAGPLDEQELTSRIDVQVKKPIRAANSTPLPKALELNSFTVRGVYQGTTEDLTREWAFAWPASIHRSGTINIKGATKKCVCANAVIQAVSIKCVGIIAFVTYDVVCGGITVANIT